MSPAQKQRNARNFRVRYRQPFIADGTPIGTAQLLWLELRTTAKGTIALHRFRPNGGTERLCPANSEAAGNAPLHRPLHVIDVSSGFGLRPDPRDKPGPPMAANRSGSGGRGSAARAAAQGGAFAAAAPGDPGRPLRLRRCGDRRNAQLELGFGRQRQYRSKATKDSESVIAAIIFSGFMGSALILWRRDRLTVGLGLALLVTCGLLLWRHWQWLQE